MVGHTAAPARFPPDRVPGRGPGWYRGDCHVHSVYSNGGELTAPDLAAAARTVGLDFIATTEHNTADAHGTWAGPAGDDLLVILGQEATTQTGHWLALGLEPGQVVDWRYGVRDGAIDRQLDQVHRVGGLCVAAHPHAPYPTGVFGYPLDGFDAVEVWNGRWVSDLPWNADNEAALADWARRLVTDVHSGQWRPAVGNSDVHLADQLGHPHTVVRAEELSTAAILAGLRAGRCWLAGSAAIELAFEVKAGGRRAGIGDRLPAADRPARVRVAVRGVPDGTVSLYTDRGRVHREGLAGDGSGDVRWLARPGEALFVRAEVRHPDGLMAALTNPIRLNCVAG